MEWKRGCSLVLAVVLMLNAVQWPEMKGWAAEPDREAGTVAGMPAQPNRRRSRRRGRMKRNGSVRAGERRPEERRPGEKGLGTGRPARRNGMRRIWRRRESAGFLSGIPGQIPEGSWKWTGNPFGI